MSRKFFLDRVSCRFPSDCKGGLGLFYFDFGDSYVSRKMHFRKDGIFLLSNFCPNLFRSTFSKFKPSRYLYNNIAKIHFHNSQFFKNFTKKEENTNLDSIRSEWKKIRLISNQFPISASAILHKDTVPSEPTETKHRLLYRR